MCQEADFSQNPTLVQSKSPDFKFQVKKKSIDSLRYIFFAAMFTDSALIAEFRPIHICSGHTCPF